jgi:hypothetical protein
MEKTEKIKGIVPVKKTGWKLFTGEDLPKSALEFAKLGECFRSRMGAWLIGCVYYKGDVNTTTDWIIVTDDGGYYKVGAQYMIWHKCSTGKIVAQAIWSNAALKRSMRALINMGETVMDPGYQT